MPIPKFSIVTPSNNLEWLKKALPSVLHQTNQDWEWVILLNGIDWSPGDLHRELGSEDRIKVYHCGGSGNVGMLKRKACDEAHGDYIVEFDHDDELAIDCLDELLLAFDGQQKPVFVFSDCGSVNMDGSPHVYGAAYGWTYHKAIFRGWNGEEELTVPDHPLTLPQNVAKIYHAPNHVRAWRKDAYREVGAHDPSLLVCDDLDLMCRLYTKGRFFHIPKTLYKYRVHGQNTWMKNQKSVDEKNWEIYDKYVETMALSAARSSGLEALDLGGGINSPVGWTSVDVHSATVIADLNKEWPFEMSSVGAIRAYDFIEHIKDPIHLMNEAYRVLVHGGIFLIEVPSTDGRGAWQDPSHVSHWNSNSFWYYCKKETQKYIKHLGVNCKFQQTRIVNYYPSEWHQLHDILYTKSHMAAIKHGPRLHGLVEI